MLDPTDHTTYDTRVAAYAVLVDRDAAGGPRVLLAWWNGEGRAEPRWSLPGGGVEFGESLVEGVVREVREETGFDVLVGRPLVTDVWAEDRGDRARSGRSVRVVFEATIVGGTLGTLEVGGSTDRAEWVRLADLPDLPRTSLVDVAVAAWLDLVAG